MRRRLAVAGGLVCAVLIGGVAAFWLPAAGGVGLVQFTLPRRKAPVPVAPPLPAVPAAAPAPLTAGPPPPVTTTPTPATGTAAPVVAANVPRPAPLPPAPLLSPGDHRPLPLPPLPKIALSPPTPPLVAPPPLPSSGPLLVAEPRGALWAPPPGDPFIVEPTDRYRPVVEFTPRFTLRLAPRVRIAIRGTTGPSGHPGERIERDVFVSVAQPPVRVELRPGDFTLDLFTADVPRPELLQRLARPFGSYRLYRLTIEEYDPIEKWFRPRYLRMGDLPAAGH